jgi:hypothetical protein
VFSYHSVVPWGRSFDEYLRMFDLAEADLSRGLLGCGDGPASFNREVTRRGHTVVSVDPLYGLPRDQIAVQIDETYADVIEQTRREADRFVWDAIGSVEELGRIRMSAMRDFLEDYDAGRRAGRYREGGLPELDFADSEFGLALCSHLLFFYAEQLPREFHLESMVELARVAQEVRVFPLVDVNAQPSPHLEPAIEQLRSLGHSAEIRRVPYEFQRGGNQMLVVR